MNISIHALREEGDRKYQELPSLQSISIHALREEGDIQAIHRIYRFLQFLSTPSARRATRYG